MKKFFTLLKVDLINGFALNKNFGKNKKNRPKKSSNLGLAILLVFLMLISTASYAFMIGNVARVANMPEVLLAYGIGAGIIVVLMMTFANAYGTLFKSRDFELLASLPIDSRIIVASKIVSLTFIGYAYYTLVYLPAFVMYIIIAGVNVMFLVSSFVVWLFAPLLVTTLCSFIAYIFGRIASRFKNKNTISTILYAIFIIALVVGIYAINFTIPRDESNVDAMVVYAQKMYVSFTTIYPVSKIAIPAMQGNLLYLLLYVAINVIPYIVFVIIIGNKYAYINTHAKDAYKNGNYDITKENKTKSKGLMRTLLQKEVKTLVSTPVYLTNVIIGPIMSIFVIVFGAYMFKYQITPSIEGDVPYSIGVNIVCALSLFLSGLAPASACSISMEGRRFWIIKSLPIDAKKYINSKVIFSYLLMGPALLVGCVVAAIMISANWLDFIMIVLVPQVASVLYSIIGLLLNLKFYNLEWDNPTQAVKQGANVVLPMVIDFGLFAQIAVLLVIGIMFNISLTWGMLLIVGILCLIFYLVVRKHGVNLYNKISA
ncbi:MAG: hypothetical protein J5691_07710 [Bacilli bacterium]|nr:hypothetical protein [Bacilli bacterium]